MSDVNSVAGGDGAAPSGQSEDKVNDGKDLVAHETYMKVLDEKKATSQKLKEAQDLISKFEAERRLKEEEVLTKNEEWKKLADARQKELDSIRGEMTEYKRDLIDSAKIQAVVDKLPGKLKKPQYYNFIDIDKIAIDPETKDIDAASVMEVANQFLSSYGELIDIKESKKLPNDDSRPGAKVDYATAIKACKTQAELDAVRRKFGRDPNYN